jgi:hypothetical protein
MELKEISVSRIKRSPFQQRQKFGEKGLQNLANSIKVKGIGLVQPIKVRPIHDPGYDFELVAGERRLRATILAGFDKILAIVDDITDVQSAAQGLAENASHVPLNSVEKAQGIIEIYRLQLDSVLQGQSFVKDVIKRIAKLRGKIDGQLMVKGEKTRLPLTPEEKEFIRVGELTGLGLHQQERILKALTLSPEQQLLVVEKGYKTAIIESIAAIEDDDIREAVILKLKDFAGTEEQQRFVLAAIREQPELAAIFVDIPPRDIEMTEEQIVVLEKAIELMHKWMVEQKEYEESPEGQEQAALMNNWFAHGSLYRATLRNPVCPKCGKDKSNLKWVCCDLPEQEAYRMVQDLLQKHTNLVMATAMQDRIDYEQEKKAKDGATIVPVRGEIA